MTNPIVIPTRGTLPVTRELTLPSVLTLLLAVLLTTTSVAGLRYGQAGLYNPDPRTLPTFLGQDAITLLVGLPLLLGSVWHARRGSLRGLLLWLGSLFCFAYSYAFYLLNPEFNALYLAYIGIVSGSLYGGLYLLLSTDADAVRARFTARTPTRLVGGFLVVMALLMTAKWVSAIVASLVSGVSPTHVDLVVWPMDLVLALPAMFWGGVWLWRRQPLGYVVAGVLLVKAASVGLTLVVNTWLVTRWGVPPDPMLPAYATIGLGSLALAVLYLRSITPSASPASADTRLQLGPAQS